MGDKDMPIRERKERDPLYFRKMSRPAKRRSKR